jgi:hypothetical protein
VFQMPGGIFSGWARVQRVQYSFALAITCFVSKNAKRITRKDYLAFFFFFLISKVFHSSSSSAALCMARATRWICRDKNHCFSLSIALYFAG